ncbi:MAG: Zn-dependent hydrolase [Chloroflexota bacterium]
MPKFPQLRINSDRLKRDFDELSEIGLTHGGGISRLALSNEDLEARAWFADRVEDAGLLVHDDEVGNLSGVYLSSNSDAKTLLIGSHLDTVPNGGRYDGALGILVGLECIRTIKEAGIQLPAHLEVIDFTDEEGTWQSFFGSLGLTGRLNDTHINDTNQDNAAFRVALFRAGIRPAEVHRAQRSEEEILAYLELHIEQSESLVNADTQIGVVSKIVGRSTYIFNFYGEATHAATTSRSKQRDALQAAARFITEMHAMANTQYNGAVFNCGNVTVQPGAYNVVPEVASLSIELRHHDEEILADMDSNLVRLAHEIAKDYRVTVGTQQVLRRQVAKMNQQMQAVIRQVCDEKGCSNMPIISYAGHDAQIMSAVYPCAMIFVPSQEGVSHSPKEFTTWQDIEAGANVMLHTILRLVNV